MALKERVPTKSKVRVRMANLFYLQRPYDTLFRCCISLE